MTVLKALKINGAILEDGSSNGTTFNYMEVSDISTTNNFSPSSVRDADENPPGDVWTLPDGTTANQLQTFSANITLTYSNGTTITDSTAYFVRLSNGETYQIEVDSQDGIYETSQIESLTVNSITNTNFTGWSSGAFGGSFTGTTICFTSGTLIKTQTGERLIEELSPGDMVLTMDHGYQPIRWIGSSKRPATGDMAPILIRKGALGNDRDLRVSPQHRMLLQGWQAELLYGEMEVLATAKSLINDHSIIRVEGVEVEYFHMLFDTHEIVWADGAPSESFHPGEQGWKGLDAPTRDEILTLFPELAEGNFEAYGPSARISLKHKEGQLLGQYMLQVNQTNEGNPNA